MEIITELLSRMIRLISPTQQASVNWVLYTRTTSEVLKFLTSIDTRKLNLYKLTED
jgi:chromosome condensin MukBEF complex kleisin-like MukF subunit